MDSTSRIRAHYVFAAAAEDAEGFARFIAREQSVEVPQELVVSSGIEDRFLGRLEDVTATDVPGRWSAEVSYDASLAAGQLPQLLNLLYGILSCHPGVRLQDFELPAEILTLFPGPRYGIEGLRQRLDAQDRPLLSTAIKPKGVSVERMMSMAHDFALGGGDIIKDDHNLADETLAGFRDRVKRIHGAVEEANIRTGGHTLYFPSVAAPWPELTERLQMLLDVGIRGVLMPPFLLGLETQRYVTTTFPLAFMAHPTFGGTLYNGPGGLPFSLAMGRLLRLIGMDVSVFPNRGGRYPIQQEDCEGLAHELRRPWSHLRPAFPAPAGGMTLEHIPEIVEVFGNDVVLLIGGALLTHSTDLATSTRLFRERLTAAGLTD